MPEETRAELSRLSGRYLLVGCHQRQAGYRGGGAGRRSTACSYVGNHGLELSPRRPSSRGPSRASARRRGSVAVEDKGLTLSFHYRNSPRTSRRRRRCSSGVATRALEAGLEARWGRKVLEVRPRVGRGQGNRRAGAALVDAEPTLALYAGDDTTDLDAFRGLADAGLEAAVRVAVASAEVDRPRSLADADLVVDGPRDCSPCCGALMGFVDEAVLGPARARYGEPQALVLEQPVTRAELDLVVASGRHGRRHDFTFFVFNGERLALIRKPHFLPGVWRPPSGGIRQGEPLEDGIAREAREELGTEIALGRYLVRTEVRFTCGDEAIEWRTHVFTATTTAEELVPTDTVEIAAARWGTVEELAGPIRAAALATGRGLWRYRVALHDAAIAALRERP